MHNITIYFITSLYIDKALHLGAGPVFMYITLLSISLLTLYMSKPLYLGDGCCVHIHNINMHCTTYIVHVSDSVFVSWFLCSST